MTAFRRLPAEWEPQDGILLAWPHAGTDWSEQLEAVEAVYLELTQQIIRSEKVIIISPESEQVLHTLQAHGIPLDNIVSVSVPTNDTWARDFGPICVEERGKPALLDFGFNGWGLKFPACHDNQVNRLLSSRKLFAARMKTQALVLEGGSIESDGMGTLLTTSGCLLSPNRNPSLDRSELAQELLELLGCTRILWLDHGHLAGDDTDSHIDTLARFAPDETIVHVTCQDVQDEHYASLERMKRQLSTFTTENGAPYRLLELPMPKAIYSDQGERLPATYANFLVINGAVLVPIYDDACDERALEIISQAFPNHEIRGIDCRPLVEQHGSLHCITMHLPKGVLA